MAFDKRKALQNALAYTQQGKWDRAIAEYQAILKADPRDVTVCNNLGDLYARAGKTAEAIDQYLKLGELYRADGLSVKAIAVYKKIAKLDPARTEAYLACADLYWEQGLVGEAKIQMTTVVEHYSRAGDSQKLADAYRRLTQFDPGNPAMITRLADALFRDGKREAAAAEYERAAQAAQAAGQTADAKRLLQKARELAPGSPKVDMALAERLIGEDKTSDAVNALKTITSAEPGNAAAWRLLGELHGKEGRAPDAVTAYQQAISAGLSESEVAAPLCAALLKASRTDEAVDVCRRMTEAGHASGHAEETIACCREVLAAAPQHLDLHAQLADMLAGVGRAEEAQDALRALARAHETANDTEAAVATYQKLLELNGADADARARLDALQPPPPATASAPEADSGSAAHVPTAAPVASEERDLALDAGDAALLLEEPQDEPADTAGRPPDTGGVQAGGQKAAQNDTSQSVDWLTQELQTIDLDEAAPPSATQPAEIEWIPTGPTLELESASAAARAADLGSLAGDSELDVAPVATDSTDVEPDSDGSGRAAVGSAESAEDASSTQVAEQLAEADVYQKYGLEEKARERLLEVVRLAPDNITAHRRLKALYLERRQRDEACGEMLALARVFRERGQEAAAVAEVREGLSLVPDHQELQQLLTAPGSAAAPASMATATPPPTAPAEPVVPTPVSLPPSPPEIVNARTGGAPPPDVPLLLDLDEEEASPEEAEVTYDLGSLDDQALPTELQALLNEPEPTAAVEAPGPSQDQSMADDLAEAEFYLSQGMMDEARAVHRRMQGRDPAHPAVAALAGQIDRATVPSSPVAPDTPVFTDEPLVQELPPFDTVMPIDEAEAVPQFTVTDDPLAAQAAEFVDLGAELEQEMGGEASKAPAPSSGPLVENLLKELQKGVREHLDEKDYETHYNLGIAYKEMELYDEAIQEFRLTAREPKRALECADLVALCYLAKGQPEQAIQDLEAGLAIPGQTADAYHTLRYDLGTAYEAAGDLPRALEQFEMLQSEGARFLDVQTRVNTLHARLRTAPSAPEAPEAPKELEKPKEVEKPGQPEKDATPRRKKKISFI